ncbi:hypothetical protein [Shouchella clausii]|uniref:hypothetical protein n=1 Tax=Shouchella clausii TaxID=79880 RepID=UPI001C72C0D4|nr:hypothetical protein [Shouchella clausii]MBX0320192.1 hypothetical protein [Shouchella clausii]MEB5480793.1 hypothetical protein [Shouchella clausii]
MSYLEYRKKYANNGIKTQLTHSTEQFVHSSFKNHPSHTLATVDENEIDVRIAREKRANPYTTFQRDLITIMCLPNTKLDIGELITIDTRAFIIYDENESELFPTYYGIKVNNTVTLNYGKKKELIGTEPSTGRPIYKEVPDEETMPCFATVNSRNNIFTEFGERINAPQDRLIVLVKYNPLRKLEDGINAFYQGGRHQIIGVDETNVSEGIGYVVLLLDKIQEKSNN